LTRYTIENIGCSTGRSTIVAGQDSHDIRTDVLEVRIPVVVDQRKPPALQQVVVHAGGLFRG
jgi:hypothetical protein